MPMKSCLDETQKEKGKKEEKGIKIESGGGGREKEEKGIKTKSGEGTGRQKGRHFSFKEPLARECLD